MAQCTNIEWTDASWNPTTGCTKISSGCKHCYAERMCNRLKAMGKQKYRNGFQLQLHEDELDAPLRWRKPRMVFVDSMSDLFHRDVPLGFIKRVFTTMAKADPHTFQVLTKRSARLRKLQARLPWPVNVWAGVTVESTKELCRIDDLRQVPASVRFVSFEPLLGPMPDLDFTGIDWAIVGGESGPGARPMDAEWVRDLRRQCRRAQVWFLLKQWGSSNNNPNPDDPTDKKNGGTAKGGRLLDGRLWHQFPEPREGRGRHG